MDPARVGTWCGSSVGSTVDAAPPPVGGQPDTANLGGSPAPRASSAPVLAMVVVDDEAPALEAVLTGLLAQDHARIEVLVVDVRPKGDRAGNEPHGPPTLVERVGQVAPSSLVVRAPNVSGHASAVATGLRVRAVERVGSPDPQFLLFVPGQVVLGDTAVRRLVERAVEVNAGVVGPKVVGPDRAVEETGWRFDLLGSPVPAVPDPEPDQGQRDVDLHPDAVAGAAWMVRADLFAELEGFDPDGVDGTGHLEFCQRARAVGAAVAVVPSAVARRVGVPDSVRHPPTLVWPRFRLRRLMALPLPVLLLRLPALTVATLAGVFYGIATGRFRHARGLLGAWPWNLRRFGSARRQARAGRLGPPWIEVSGHGESWWLALRRVATGRVLAGDDDRSDGLRYLNGAFGAVFGPGGLAIMIAAAILGFGSRSLVVNGLSPVGRLQRLPAESGDLVATWWAGWRSTGTGTSGSGPDGLGLVGLLARIWPYSSNSLWTVLVLGSFAVGALGIWRLARPVGGGRSRAVAVLVYLAVPIPYEALRAGRLATLAAYAVMPWLVRRLAGAQAMAPYGLRGGEPGPGTRLRSLWSDVLVTGLALVAVVGVDPVLLVPATVVFVGLVVGTTLTGTTNGLFRLSIVAGGGAALAALVHLPTVFSVLGSDGRGWADWLGGPIAGGWGATDSIGLKGIFSLNAEPDGLSATMALFILPALALVAARGRHLSVVVRAWFVVVGAASLLVMLDREWLGEGGSALRAVDPGVLLVVVAVGLAWASAAGVAGLGSDLAHLARQVHTGRSVRMVRNGLLGVVAVGLSVGVVPVLAGSLAGDWGTARADLASALPGTGGRLVDGQSVHGGIARVLWLGDPTVLPAAGVPLTSPGDRSGRWDPLAMAVTDGLPDLSDQWTPGETAGLAELRSALRSALEGATHRLGADLGRWGVANVVVVNRSAPVPEPGIERPVPDRLLEVLARQLDLERVEAVNGALVVYRNTTVEAPFSVVRDRNRRVVPALIGRRSMGDLVIEAPADGALRWMVGPDDRWRVRVDGRPATVLASGEAYGVDHRPSVRVATGSVVSLKLDDGWSTGRRRLQMVLAGLLALLASWARTSREVSLAGEQARVYR